MGNNALENKPGIAFTSTSSMHGGQEITIFNLITFMLHHGMIISGTPYSFSGLNKTKSGGTPYGASHVENFNSSNELTKDEYDIAKNSGARLAKLIKKISYNDVINKNLRIMDLTAISLAKDTKIPIFITNIFKNNALIDVLNQKGAYSKIS